MGHTGGKFNQRSENDERSVLRPKAFDGGRDGRF